LFYSDKPTHLTQAHFSVMVDVGYKDTCNVICNLLIGRFFPFQFGT